MGSPGGLGLLVTSPPLQAAGGIHGCGGGVGACGLNNTSVRQETDRQEPPIRVHRGPIVGVSRARRPHPPSTGSTGPPRSGSQSSSLELVLFTVASAHLLAMEAHEGQVVEHGGDYYLHRLVPLPAAPPRPEAAGPRGAWAEMAAVLPRVIEDTRAPPDVPRRYDTDRLRALEVPEE